MPPPRLTGPNRNGSPAEDHALRTHARLLTPLRHEGRIAKLVDRVPRHGVGGRERFEDYPIAYLCDAHFPPREAKFFGQAHSLATSVREELCNPAHVKASRLIVVSSGSTDPIGGDTPTLGDLTAKLVLDMGADDLVE
jgi:hypothetical protein